MANNVRDFTVNSLQQFYNKLNNDILPTYASMSYVESAYAYILNEIVDNEYVIAQTFNSHNDRITALENVDTPAGTLTGVNLNGNAVTVNNGIAEINTSYSVTINITNGNYVVDGTTHTVTADHYYNDIQTAINEGKTPYAIFNDSMIIPYIGIITDTQTIEFGTTVNQLSIYITIGTNTANYMVSRALTSETQADWNETDNSSYAYILNKPDIVWERGEESTAIKIKGNNNHAYSPYSIAEGRNTYTGRLPSSMTLTNGWEHSWDGGEYVHAEGINTYAYGEASHAEGGGTIAYGETSHAEGDETLAYGNASHTEGHGVTAYNNYEHAEGLWNISVQSNTASEATIHTIGIGTEYENKKNAFAVMKNGNAYFINVGNYNGTNLTSSNSIQKIINDLTTDKAKIFYGVCSTAGATVAKEVTCTSFTEADLVKGTLIFVTFDTTNSGAVANLTMSVNSTTAKPIKKQGNASSTNNLTNAGELRANSTYLFQYDGTNWVCMTLDYNSTYSALSEADMQAGTATTGRTITAARLKTAITYWMSKNQSDWNETDETSPSYILNKPTIPSTAGLATETYVNNKVAGIINSAPETLDTLNELATALGNDPNFATTVSTEIGTKVSKTELAGLGYVTQTALSNQSYITTTALNTRLNNAGYISSIPSEYITQNELSANGYLTSFTESDPTVPSYVKSITQANINAWNSYANVQADWNETDNNSNAYILNKPTIPSTLDQIADGSTRKLSNYLPLSGGSMNYGSSISLSLGIENDYTILSGGSIYFEDYDEEIGTQYGIYTIRARGKEILIPGDDYDDAPPSNIHYDDTFALLSDIPIAVTESTVSGWGFTKNTGTITGITMNGASKGTSGVVDLGTVITSETQSDWNITDTSSAAYIKNKPTIPSITGLATEQYVDEEILANATTESTVSGWGFTKNAGTITGITMNGASKGTSGVVDLGTVLTAHQDISGKQDTITDLATIRSNASAGAAKVSANDSTITIQKGGTNVDTFTTNAASSKTINIPNELPTYSSSDAGKVLSINSSGQLVWITPVSIYTGSGEPSNSVGNDGDIYLQS